MTPVTATNPVGTQHILVATVKDKNGKPLAGQPVEWMILDPSVGGFVEVDRSCPLKHDHKVDNTYAVTHTVASTHTITRGNSNPADDVHIKSGQSWAVITSAVEGTTHVVAYCPSICNWDKHKAFAVKHWRDIGYEWPPNAENPVGMQHVVSTRVMRHSDGAALQGYPVKFEVVSGPPAHFAESKQTSAVVNTGADGVAKATLVQDSPVEGQNQVNITVSGAAGQPEEMTTLATGSMVKTWVAPKLAVKKDAPASAGMNETLTYTINVSNPGKTDAKNVVVYDELPAGMEYVSSQPPAERGGQMEAPQTPPQAQAHRGGGEKLRFNIGNLPAGGQQTITVQVRSTALGQFENCAVAMADGLRAESFAVTKVAAAALTLRKTAPAQALLCDPVEYVLEVTNTGDAAAMNVKVRDDLPEGMSWRNQRAVSFDVGTLEPGQTKRMRFQGTASRAGSYTDNAQATGDGGLTASAQATVNVVQPQLVVTKDAPNLRYLNNDVPYRISVRNNGPVDAASVVVTDTLPGGTSFVSATEGGKESGGTVTWNVGTLKVNETRDFQLVLHATQIGTLTNKVTVGASCAGAETTAQTEIRGISAVLLEMVDTMDPIPVGGTEVYKITVTNQGSAEDSNIVIAAIMPEEMSFVSSDGPTTSTVDGQNVTFAPLAKLAPKAQAVWTVQVKANKPGDLRFYCELRSAQLTEPVREDEATHVYSGD